MPVLELLHTRTFDAEMNRLRCECFPQEYSSGDSRDRFDDRSFYVVARVDGLLAAYGRLTPGPDAWFESDSGAESDIPTGPHVMDFGRVVVAPAHRGRGHDLFELILVEGLILSINQGFDCVVGAYRTDRGFRPFIHELGFQASGVPVQSRIAPPQERYQMVVARTNGRRDHWLDRKIITLGRLRDKDFDIIDHGCPVK